MSQKFKAERFAIIVSDTDFPQNVGKVIKLIASANGTEAAEGHPFCCSELWAVKPVEGFLWAWIDRDSAERIWHDSEFTVILEEHDMALLAKGYQP